MRQIITRHKRKALLVPPLIFFLFLTTQIVAPRNTLSVVIAGTTHIPVGEEFSVGVEATSHVPINVIGGSLVLPDDIEVLAIDISRSIIDLWVEKPSVERNDAGALVFSGGTTQSAGFSGSGEVFSVTLKAGESGTRDLIISEALMLSHDGRGENVLDVAEPLTITVLPDAALSPQPPTDSTVAASPSPLSLFGLVGSMFGTHNPLYDFDADGKTTIKDLSLYFGL